MKNHDSYFRRLAALPVSFNEVARCVNCVAEQQCVPSNGGEKHYCALLPRGGWVYREWPDLPPDEFLARFASFR